MSAQGEELFEDLKATCALIWGYEGKIDDLMSACANEKAENVTLEGPELVGTTPKQQEVLTTRARLVSSHRRAAEAIFFKFITGARGADVHDSSLVVFGGGGVPSAVDNHLGSASSFWWNVWLISTLSLWCLPWLPL